MRAWLCAMAALLLIAACGEEFTGFDADAGAGAGTTGSGSTNTGTDTSTTSSGTATSTGTGTGTATETTPGVPEICGNGIDDDGDDKVDCEDDECVCAPAPPDGWVGLGWILAKAEDSCPAGTFVDNVELFEKSELKAESAKCECDCSGGKDVGCETQLTCSNGSECNLAGFTTTIGQSCTTFPQGTFSASVACKASPPYAVGGKCDPKPTTDLKNVEWAPSKRACLYENDGSCEAKGTCLPAPAGDTYGPCIGREGDFECPAPYTDKQTFYDNGYDDTRGCTDCGCEPPGGATCACANPSCGVGMHGSPDCKPPWIVTVPANNTCTPFAVSNNGLSGFLLNAKVTAPGTCKPWAVTPTGGVSPKGKRTVCCLP